MEKLTKTDIDDLQIGLAIVLDRPNASKRFAELWDKLDHFRQSWQGSDMCEWENYTDEKGYSWHETSCGGSIDSELSPKSNGFIYCPFCAGKIKYIYAVEPHPFTETELSNDELDEVGE